MQLYGDTASEKLQNFKNILVSNYAAIGSFGKTKTYSLQSYNY